jgi:hypothetical protein
MTPVAKLLKIREMCEHAIKNPTPMATLIEISRIAGLLDDDHEWQYPATSVVRRVPGSPDVSGATFLHTEVRHPRHVPTQEQHCRDNPPALFIPEVASDITEQLARRAGELKKACQQRARADQFKATDRKAS